MDAKNNSAFLEKFRGKTNLISKRGLTHLIESINFQNPSPTQTAEIGSTRPSLYRDRSKDLAQLPKQMKLDNIISSIHMELPTRKLSENKSRENNREQRIQYVPSFVINKSTSVINESRKYAGQSIKTPLTTRGTIRQQLNRYNDYSLEKNPITSNTKVNQDAFRHLEFLNIIENRIKGGVND